VEERSWVVVESNQSGNNELKVMFLGVFWGFISWIYTLHTASINFGIEAFNNPLTMLLTLPTNIPYNLFLLTGRYSSMRPISMGIFFLTFIPLLPMITGWGLVKFLRKAWKFFSSKITLKYPLQLQ
jgi:hypothetical protein